MKSKSKLTKKEEELKFEITRIEKITDSLKTRVFEFGMILGDLRARCKHRLTHRDENCLVCSACQLVLDWDV